MYGKSAPSFDEARKRSYYVSQPMRMATGQPLRELGLVEAESERFNAFQLAESGKDSDISTGEDFKPTDEIYIAPPVACLVWTRTGENIGDLSVTDEEKPDMDVRGPDGHPCERNTNGSYKWGGERPRQVRVAWPGLDKERKHEALVPVIDELGRIAATRLPPVEIQDIWWRLEDFPASFEEDSMDSDDSSSEEVPNPAKPGTASGGPVSSYPIRTMMELVEKIANRQTSISRTDWNSWCIRLEHTLTQAAESDVLNTFRKMLFERMKEEYSVPRGGFARLMYGGTAQSTRRMLQLAFNRIHSFPKVLVAQSMVGREGLNLHEACRTVVMLHPEWNPGVVEQQIGRVDRVGSYWSKLLDEALQDGKRGDELPRIEVRPVVFKGTYDEHNWKVLRKRWDDLRSQLHGIVIPNSRIEENDEEGEKILDKIAGQTPDFSPARQVIGD